MHLASLEENRTLHHTVSPTELEYMAYVGQGELVHGIFKSIPAAGRSRYANSYVLREVVSAGIQKLRRFLASSEEEAAQREKDFLDETVRMFLRNSRSTEHYSRELFVSMLDWAEELRKLSLVDESFDLYNEAIAAGINRFPELLIRAERGRAHLVSSRGHVDQGHSILSSLAERPYLNPDRKQIASIILELGKAALLSGNADRHASVMFRGLRHFYVDMEQRGAFVEQIRTTYRNVRGLIFHRNVRLGDKALFLMHWSYFAAVRRPILRPTGIPIVLRMAILGYVYLLNYCRAGVALPGSPLSTVSASRGVDRRSGKSFRTERKGILITRAMGGIGDFLMMTPGFHALKRKYPGVPICLAVPRRYFSVFAGNTDVELVDIEDAPLDLSRYRKWFNFTDCPAARTESRTAPRVRRSRIDIFSRALGIGPFTRWRMDHRPRYFISEEEQLFQKKFWRAHKLEGKCVIGVQLHSDETYRNYPHMETLVRTLAGQMTVLLFDGERISGSYPGNVVKVDSLPLRQSFALARSCDAIIAPDSSFVHFAAAFEIPCVGLYGPIDGKVRTKHYPACTYVDVRSDLRCVPCWRNETIPCKLTHMRPSACMIDLDVQRVIAALHDVLNRRRQCDPVQ